MPVMDPPAAASVFTPGAVTFSGTIIPVTDVSADLPSACVWKVWITVKQEG